MKEQSLSTVFLYTYITPGNAIKLCICISWNKGQDDPVQGTNLKIKN